MDSAGRHTTLLLSSKKVILVFVRFDLTVSVILAARKSHLEAWWLFRWAGITCNDLNSMIPRL